MAGRRWGFKHRKRANDTTTDNRTYKVTKRLKEDIPAECAKLPLN